MTGSRAIASVALLAWLAACGARDAAAERLPVVASFSIVADFVRAVGGERVRVDALVGPDADAHVFEPKPSDAARLAGARLVVVNGLGFEGWVDRLVVAAGYRGQVVVASRGVDVLRSRHDHHQRHAPGHGHAGADPRDRRSDRGGAREAAADPHAWQDVGNARRYVANVEDALAAVDPAGAPAYRANATAYLAMLDALDAEIRALLGRLPADRRKAVTSHDAFGYFARAYRIEFAAPVGASTHAEATAADVARLIRQIRRERIAAVFVENVSDPRLLQRIRAESGARIGGTLYSDALSAPDGPAASYVAMMRHNARTIAQALAP